MTVLNLSAEERARFAAWLEQEAATDKSLAEQMEKLPGVPAVFVAQRSAEAKAALLIARKLRASESLSGERRPR